MTVRVIKPSEPSFMTAERAATRNGYQAQAELNMRHALEAFCRDRWSDARIVHELVMGQGKVRADVVAIAPVHIAAFEVKSGWDDTSRLLHQVGMYQLCVPEVWMVVDQQHDDDARLINWLMPSIGILSTNDTKRYTVAPDQLVLSVIAEAAPREVIPEMTLRLLWAEELHVACDDAGVPANSRATRTVMVKRLLATLKPKDILVTVCRALRARDALWRADAPM